MECGLFRAERLVLEERNEAFEKDVRQLRVELVPVSR